MLAEIGVNIVEKPKLNLKQRWELIQAHATNYFAAKEEARSIRHQLSNLVKPERINVIDTIDEWQAYEQAKSEYDQLKNDLDCKETAALNKKNAYEKLLLEKGLLPEDMWITIPKSCHRIKLLRATVNEPRLEVEAIHNAECEKMNKDDNE